MTGGSSIRVATKVAQIRPETSWPVPPMLNRPTRKPSPIPSPAAISGLASLNVSVRGLIAPSKVAALAL